VTTTLHPLYQAWGDEFTPVHLERLYLEELSQENISPQRALWVALRKFILFRGGVIKVGEDSIEKLVRTAQSLEEW
jgi:hypothetical protein